MKVAEPHYSFLRGLLKRRTGVCIDDSKQYLVVARLLPIVRQRNLAGIEALLDLVQRGPDASLERDVLCAMMTHETSFFRDRAPFDALRRIVADLATRRAREKSLVIWSAACSTGQEPYSIAMLLQEHFRDLLATWRIRIIASDYSESALTKAREGIYGGLETARGLTPPLLAKYFRPLQGKWSVVHDCRRLVEFRQLNLVSSWPPMPPCDVIFLRNVMLYFDVPTRAALVGRMKRALRPDGAMFLGGAETLIGVDDGWDRIADVGSCHYRPRSRGPSADARRPGS
ncbi:MAG: CheR family methyltransferase [Planctomycetaceae bacterium]